MADIQQTALLVFDIDEQPAVNSIKDLRQANSQLRAERDKVNISTKEGKELVDKLNVAIDKNNKVIKDNSSALEKQRQNVGNYSKSIQEAAGNLNIMGTNVGALGAKLTSFVNPATAAVAIVGALGAAYASSTIGARDLTFASNQLAAATGILTNQFASLISSSEDGEGAVTKLFNAFLRALGPAGNALAIQSKAIALAQQQLEDFRRNELIAQTEINERLKENAQITTDLAESNIDYAEKINLVNKAISNLTKNEDQILAIKNQQLAAIDRQLSGDATNEKLLDDRALKELEISSIKKDTERAISRIQKQESNLLDTYNKQTAALKKQGKGTGVTPTNTETGPNILGSLTPQSGADQEIRLSNEATATVVSNDQIKGESAEDYTNRVLALQEAQAAGARNLAGVLSDIADEGTAAQKALALTSIAINSGIGVSEAVKAGAGIPFPGNLAAILSGITAVLAGIAQAKSLLGFAEGGWTGPGSKYKPVGVVHADEYVTPKHIVHSPAAQPHLAALERMRTGYYDGGFVTNSNMQSTRDAMLTANFMKNFPPIYTSWTEGRTVGKRVEFKEKVTRQ